jgi:hypothetical protein
MYARINEMEGKVMHVHIRCHKDRFLCTISAMTEHQGQQDIQNYKERVWSVFTFEVIEIVS